MVKKNLQSSELHLNRELSWLEFNDRVLCEGLSGELPLLERLKFLAIVSSNLDEFYLVRVAGLMQQRAANVDRCDPAGMTPAEQIEAIAARAHPMVARQSAGIREVLGQLRGHGLVVWEPREWTAEQRGLLQTRFTREILPVLTPLAIQELDPSPLLPGLQLYVGAVITLAPSGVPEEPVLGAVEEPPPALSEPPPEAPAERIVVIPVPARFSRFLDLPTVGQVHLVRLEDVIAENVGALFPGYQVLAKAVFRITRDADVTMEDEEAEDLLTAVEQAVLDRRRRAAVRLEISADPDPRLRQWLTEWLALHSGEVYEIEGIVGASALMEIAERPGFEALKIPPWPPQQPRDLIGCDDLWDALQDHDVMLFHPYESFDPVVELAQKAADDPDVLAIKQTLYRTSGDSPIVRALQRAGQNGKEVTVLVELKARFDEARNVQWARRLEDAGCHVIYGIAGYKTHAKALLVVRRESGRIRRYVHLATGNYNDRTARIYSDVGIMTTDRDVAGDVAAFFNLLTGYSEGVAFSKLHIAPTGLKRGLLDLIDREIRASSLDEPGLIMAKVNSLQDTDVIEALYRASQAGVKILLNIRGICCLRPGIKGASKNIEVVSIIDRFLEHARVFYFRNGGHEEVYLSSADWMRRNLIRRLEILFPVIDPNHRRRLVEALQTYFADNVKARRLLPDGRYEPVAGQGKRVRAQERLYQEAVQAVRSAEQTAPRFRPLLPPEE